MSLALILPLGRTKISTTTHLTHPNPFLQKSSTQKKAHIKDAG